METGTRLGPYEIEGQLGAGGMGEVYLAQDTRLGRKVAIKVLPEQYAGEAERLARFEQEARAAAALNHPHIAAIHDVGETDGTHYMVQEYLQGETLRDALAGGAMPLERALALGIEIVAALRAAHRAGIVHRDLKPENVLVSEDGHAKVLDFGLAKLTEMGMTAPGGATMSPTVLGTQAGVIMGTAGYMAPEQVQGEEVDERADLFALGCLLYEMVAGERAFAGDNVHETLSRILSKPPPPLPEKRADLPAHLGWIADKALQKDPARRYQHADDLLVDLQALAADVESGVAAPASDLDAEREEEASAGSSWRLAAQVAVAALLVGVLGTWLATRPAPPVPELPVRFEFALPEDVRFTNAGRRSVAISPDGSRIVFVGNSQLWTRGIGDLEPTPIPGTESARTPFFSPDGQQIGFATQDPNQLKRISITGGAAVVLGPASNPFGASWAENGMIYFGQGGRGIWQVPGTGGTPEVVVEVHEDESAHGPQLLPGGEWLLFTLRSGGGWNEASIVAHSLVTGERVVLIEGGTDGRWVPTGHLVYALNATLFAVAFDPRVMERPTGATSMVQGVRMTGASGSAQYGFSDNGRLVYAPGVAGSGDLAQIAWVDRAGRVEPLPFEPTNSSNVALSPDGLHIALEIESDDSSGADADSIWIYEVERGGRVLLTTAGDNENPVWSPDGEWVYFSSERDGNRDIWRRRADRSLEAELVLDLEDPIRPAAISADGSQLAFHNGSFPDSDGGILALDAEQEPEMLLTSPAFETMGGFSPDGRFITFASNETGQLEAYVMELASHRTFPVSTIARGGAGPRWSREGTEIYYSSSNSPTLLAARVTTEPFSASEPFEIANVDRRFRTNFDASADGQRFLIIQTPGGDGEASARTSIRVVLNWFEELKARVPTGR